MPIINPDGYDISPLRLILWDFKYTEFIRERWSDEQIFIIKYKGFIDPVFLKAKAIDKAHFDLPILYYHPINIMT